MRKEIVVSFLIACAVIWGAIWVFSRSLPPIELPNVQRAQDAQIDSRTHSAKSQIQDGTVNYVPDARIKNESTPIRKIFKCVVNGKTHYSDDECSDKMAERNLELHSSAGIVSPPKEKLEELTAKRIAAETAYERRLLQQVTPLSRSSKEECYALTKNIEWLDAMARQPQSGQMQDWIKQERTKARDRQFHIHC